MIELKPCPFCGGEAKDDVLHWLGFVNYSVECENCGARTKEYDHAYDARKAWNRRVNSE